jgi:hypothetical protein
VDACVPVLGLCCVVLCVLLLLLPPSPLLLPSLLACLHSVHPMHSMHAMHAGADKCEVRWHNCKATKLLAVRDDEICFKDTSFHLLSTMRRRAHLIPLSTLLFAQLGDGVTLASALLTCSVVLLVVCLLAMYTLYTLCLAMLACVLARIAYIHRTTQATSHDDNSNPDIRSSYPERVLQRTVGMGREGAGGKGQVCWMCSVASTDGVSLILGALP